MTFIGYAVDVRVGFAAIIPVVIYLILVKAADGYLIDDDFLSGVFG